MNPPAQSIRTAIWHEEPEADNPFATRRAFCRGYDVFGQMLGRSRWVEMLWLLFRAHLPDYDRLELLEALAVALANPGPRDAAVHAAMCGGACGSTAAASLMAALSAAAGRHGGARDVFDAMTAWQACGCDLAAWADYRFDTAEQPLDTWPAREHPPGFDPNGVATPTAVVEMLATLAAIGRTPHLGWLAENRAALEELSGLPLSQAGVAAAAFVDLGFTPGEGEMLHLLLRLPGAAAHAIEQTQGSFRDFPFYAVKLANDPQQKDMR